MDLTKLKEVLEKHLHWIRGDCEGWENMKANLCEANLCGADLYGANLYGANLCGANLYGANLYGANLYGANLRGANLYGADLREANLYGADLSGADLYRADLYGADLYRADLYGAKIDDKLINKLYPICCPEYGAFIGWKNAHGYIVKLQITEDAKRSSAFGRKCRCSEAVVLNIENPDGSDSGLKEIASEHDPDFVYRVGETVEVADFDENRIKECAPGIHFFITRDEAVNY